MGLRLVGRHIFKGGSPIELPAYGDGQLVSVAGPITVLPEPGSVVLVHGHEKVWLAPLYGLGLSAPPRTVHTDVSSSWAARRRGDRHRDAMNPAVRTRS